jgi:hypothetical protein
VISRINQLKSAFSVLLLTQANMEPRGCFQIPVIGNLQGHCVAIPEVVIATSPELLNSELSPGTELLAWMIKALLWSVVGLAGSPASSLAVAPGSFPWTLDWS